MLITMICNLRMEIGLKIIDINSQPAGSRTLIVCVYPADPEDSNLAGRRTSRFGYESRGYRNRL